GAMSEGFRNDGAAGAALQGVIPDLGSRIQRGLDVSRLEAPAVLALRARGPHTCKAVRLQLQAHAECIRLRIICAQPLLIHTAEDAEQVLHVMTDFMADDIRVRELSRRTELSGHEVEKAEIEIHDAVVRTVERAGCRFALTAGRRITVPEEPQVRILIREAALLESRRPDRFGAA